MEIITKQINPPIPSNRFDWFAVREDDDEGDYIGYGKTEQEAINDLIDQLEYIKSLNPTT